MSKSSCRANFCFALAVRLGKGYMESVSALEAKPPTHPEPANQICFCWFPSGDRSFYYVLPLR